MLGALLVPLTVVMALLWAPGTATADPWPPLDRNGVPMHPDRFYHWYCMYSVPDGWQIPENMQDNARAVTIDALGNRTETTVSANTTCNFTPEGGRTDAVYAEHFLAADVYGETWCHDAWGPGEEQGHCDRADIIIGSSEIVSDAPDFERELNHTMCHELGHTVGLSHYPFKEAAPDGIVDCMLSDIWEPADGSDLASRTYDPHHVGHINAWFDEQG